MDDNLSFEIPHWDETPKMGVTVNSPTSLFVWWELPQSERAEIEDKANGSVEWCLAVRDQDTGNESVIRVDPKVGNHYVELQPGKKYQVALGWNGAEEFHSVCGPLEADMPPETPESGRTPEWVDIRKGQKVEPEEKTSSQRTPPQPRPGLEWEEGLVGNGASESVNSSYAAGDEEREKTERVNSGL